jgi:hypothetical protein
MKCVPCYFFFLPLILLCFYTLLDKDFFSRVATQSLYSIKNGQSKQDGGPSSI